MKSQGAGASILIAVVIALTVGSLVADRLGAPADLVAGFSLIVAVAALVASGLSAHSMKPSAFYAAGHALSPAATGALLLTLAAGFGMTTSGALDLQVFSAALAGLLLFALTAAGPLRRIGGYTFADAIEARFGSRLLTATCALAAFAVMAALALRLGPLAVDAVARVSGASLTVARIAVILLACAVALPGGLAGLAGAALVAAALLLLSWSAPLLSALSVEASLRDYWLSDAATRLTDASLPGSQWPLLALAAGGLFAFANIAEADGDQQRPARAAALAILAGAAVAFCLVFAQAVETQRVSAIRAATAQSAPPIVFSDRFRGVIRICGAAPTTPDDLRRICERAGHRGVLPPQAIEIAAEGGRWKSAVLGVSSAVGEGIVLSLPFLLVAGLAMAGHAAAAALMRDLMRRFVLPPLTAGGDLALQRLATLGVLAIAVAPPAWLSGMVTVATPLLLFCAATLPLPLLLLARWRRADWRAALCGLASGMIAGACLWTGVLDGPSGALAGLLCTMAAGLLAAAVFPARTPDPAVAVMDGAAPGPLVLDRSA